MPNVKIVAVSKPIEMAIKESKLLVNFWPIAKAIKNGDHVAAVTIPLSVASAANLLVSNLLSFGIAEDKIGTTPKFKTPPKKCAANCNPLADALAGRFANFAWVRLTDGIIEAVALTRAIVGIKAQNINAYLPDAIQSSYDGISSIKDHPMKQKNSKIKKVLFFNFGRVSIMKMI